MAVCGVPRVSAGKRKHIVGISDTTVPCKKWLICCDMLFLFNPPSRGMCDMPVEGEPELWSMIAWKATLTMTPQTEPQFAQRG